MTEFRNVFVDTSPFIYFLENNPIYHYKVRAFFESCSKEGKSVSTSVITVEEYCVTPYQNKEMDVIQKFRAFLADMGIHVSAIDDTVARKAAEIRAEYKDFKAMDALQLAAACIMGCDLFFTNEKQLKQFMEMPCILVDEQW